MKVLIIILLTIVFSGCAIRTQPHMTYAEWQEKVKLEAEAKRLGVSYTYMTRAELRETIERDQEAVDKAWRNMWKEHNKKSHE